VLVSTIAALKKRIVPRVWSRSLSKRMIRLVGIAVDRRHVTEPWHPSCKKLPHLPRKKRRGLLHGKRRRVDQE
jgi:hypothetical protein